ncbi:PilZ domain-containing protein [Novosphingobium malaysiense]|uniref:PilZ domain-containing protein n=1 Tax=Novosphingobium malaysiense TaxID=1348853 RepID=A0A0B1ZRA4_9SPHN|nr:PilZ domain-containing protein [Novosphingobium malaysiense]KHK91819.1 hypothetical protein LK12_13825 [Novosphingobium malaysiense]
MLDPDRRSEPRTRADLSARLRCKAGECAITLLDASTGGIQAMSLEPPARGEVVELLVGEHALPGRIRWQSGQRFGLSFRDRISVEALLDGGHGPVTLAQIASAQRHREGWNGAWPFSRKGTGKKTQIAAVFAGVGIAVWAVSALAGSSRASETKPQTAMVDPAAPATAQR